VTQSLPQRLPRATRILITVFAIVAPVSVAIAWWFESDAHFNFTFEGLRLDRYMPILFASTAVAIGIPLGAVVHSLIVRIRHRGLKVPLRAIVSGGISLLLALPMVFEALPLVAYEIDLGHAPSAEETSVSSATLLARAKAFEDDTAAAIGESITRRDPPTAFGCELSNGHIGHGYTVASRMVAPPTQAAIAAVLAYWKSRGYPITHQGFRYSATPIHQLAPALTVTPQVFEVEVTTSCVTH
jgi:hypothetical protein